MCTRYTVLDLLNPFSFRRRKIEVLHWKQGKAVMSSEFMSSEESDPDDSSGLIKRCIPWRSIKATDFFHKLDSIQENSRSGQGKRQRKSRVIVSETSSRPIPVTNVQGKKIPMWAIAPQFRPTSEQ